MNNLCKILLVDDEYLLRQGLKYLCNWEAEGFTIVGEASNGKEALALVHRYHPTIVITDIVMPVVDGVELIKAIKKFDSQIAVIVLSSYGDFDYVKSCFKYGVEDYILKPTLQPNELLPLLHNIKNSTSNNVQPTLSLSLAEQLSFKLLTSLKGINQLTDDSIDIFHNYFTTDTYIFLLGDFSHCCHNQDDFFKLSTQLILPNIKHTLSDFTYIDYPFNSYLYGLLINVSGSQSDTLEEQILQLIDALKKSNLHFHFALGDTFTQLDQLKTHHNKTIELLEYSFYFEDTYLLSPSLIPSVQHSILFDFNKYYQHLECLDSTQVKDYVVAYIKQVVKHVDCDVLSLKKTLENIIYSSIHFLENLGFDVDALNTLKITCLKDIEATKSATELIHLILSLINQIFISAALQTDKAHCVIINKVTSYIKENYKEQFSLATIADNLHLNYHYLSGYFNNHTKESFTDYVNKIRIQKAKELLSDSNLSIAEVSEEVGYTDQSYFGKVFKKLTSTTPSAYRRKSFFKGKSL